MKNRLLFCLFVLITGMFGIAGAQGDELPLILWIRGDLYSVDALGAAPTPITTNGTISGAALAPDRKTIAYKVAAPVGLDALSRLQTGGLIADFDLPGDIDLLDLATGTVRQIAGQPADASLFVEGAADNVTIRSTPVWSPDASRLAWTEYAYPDGKPLIVIDDLATGTQTIIVRDIPAPLVQGAAPPVLWGQRQDGSGVIAVNLSTDAAGEQDFLIYAEDGTHLSSSRFAAVAGDPVLYVTWVQSPQGDLLGLFYQSARWILIDPTSGVALAAAQVPHLTTAQPGSLELEFGLIPDTGLFWEVVGGTAAVQGTPGQVTLSPSGQQIAFTGIPSFGAVTLLNASGNSTSIPNTGSNLDELQVGALLWGYTFWRIS